MIEQSAVGRIVVAPEVPQGHALFYTTRDFDGRDFGEVERVLRERFGIIAPIADCHQVHGISVRGGQALLPVLEERGQEQGQAGVPVLHECDALWADVPCALAIKVADCLPVSIIGDGVIANIHSGWRSAAQRIVDVTLDALPPFDPRDAAAWLGPTIRVCCFEVGEEVVERFRQSYPDAEQFVDRTHPKPHIDIPLLTAAVLRARGIERIHDSRLCTRCDGSIFHSYRRDGKRGGRNLAILGRS